MLRIVCEATRTALRTASLNELVELPTSSMTFTTPPGTSSAIWSVLSSRGTPPQRIRAQPVPGTSVRLDDRFWVVYPRPQSRIRHAQNCRASSGSMTFSSSGGLYQRGRRKESAFGPARGVAHDARACAATASGAEDDRLALGGIDRSRRRPEPVRARTRAAPG